MVYRVLADGIDIFGSDTESSLLSPSLEMELNSAGSLEFTLPPDHPSYDDISLMQTEIEVYEDDDLIFFGRPAEVGIDWNKQKKVVCEGALAYLNDAAIRPHKFEGALISDVFKYIIAQYNAQVAQNKQFIVGNITITDRYVYTEFDYDICLSVLISTCIDSTGGYLFLRKEDAGIYIDWLAEVPDVSDQPVQFASNMLDLNQDTRAEDICTVVLPVGGQVDGVNITIASVNQGSDILEDSDAIAKYGRILKIQQWNDIIDPQALKDKATEWLAKQQEDDITIETDAAELHYLDGSVGAYRIGQLVNVISGPHGVDKEYPILKMSMDLDSGTKKITLGTPPRKELTELSGITNSTGGSSSSGGGGGGGSSDGVRDVLVNGLSVVSDHVARVSAVTAQQLADGLALKADEDDFEALQTTVAGKASQADLNALSTTVAGKQDKLTPGAGINIDANNVISATGGGGTEVEANPSEAATDDLTKVKIGDTIYDIPGGGSYTAGSHIDISNNEISVRLHDDSPLTPSEFDYTGAVQTYTAPYDAIYKLQVWGASGGDGTNGRSHAGYGGYTEGKISLTAGEVLYIYVGQAGVGGSSGGDSTRFNGGGKANHSGSWSRGSGGGATHIAKVSGLLSSLDQNVNDILVVAGGGGGAGYYSSNEYGTGGSGGGYIGGNGVMRTSGTAGTGATQQAGGTGAETGSFGKGADKSDTSGYGGSGGGGGFYGGGSSANTSGAGGGSGYYNPNLTDACMYGYEVSESSGSSNKTVSVSEYDADPVPQVAKSGDGYAIITCLGSTGTDLITREDMGEAIEEAIEEAQLNNLTMMSDYYSEEEHLIGRWTDGKPLYQKVLTIPNLPNATSADYPHGIQNVDNIWVSDGVAKNTQTGSSCQLNNTASNNVYQWVTNVDRTNVSIWAGTDRRAFDYVKVILKYTKTTDAPGSGVIPEDPMFISDPMIFSEEEQVVGSWTDGKPIYQKTFLNIAVQSGISNVFTHNLGIDKYIDFSGRCCVNGDGWSNAKPLPYYQINWSGYVDILAWDTNSIAFNSKWNSSYVDITIQYTKVADSPLSGPKKGKIVQRSDIYSEEERLVGRWTDGKPLYQKTWFNVANNTDLISNVDTLVDYDVKRHGNASGDTGFYDIGDGFQMTDSALVKVINGVATYTSWTGTTGYINKTADFITLKYTKTTDLPFSKQLIEDPQFVMMSDYYSENEQVVGRWTDGKPLYQKSGSIIYTANTPDWTLVENLDNYDYLVSSYGTFYEINGTNKDYIPHYGGRTSDPRLCVRKDHKLYHYYNSYPGNNRTMVYDYTVQYTKTTDAPGTGPTKGNLIYLPALYSEEEREVGVWKDGKPIYQKNIPIPAIQSAQSGVLISNLGLNIDNCVDIKVRLYKDTGVDNDTVIATASFGDMYFYYRKSEDSIRMDAPFSWVVGRYGNATIQYTKTTDQPGSGTWTPEGQLAHHYSTSEKIVGTWIDGSTVYERTIQLTANLVTNDTAWTQVQYDNPVTNMSHLIDCKVLDGTGTYLVERFSSNNQMLSAASKYSGTSWNAGTFMTIQYTKTS